MKDPIDTEVLADLLSLVMEDPPSEEAIAKWSDDQRWYAERWAAADYMSASDNPTMRYCKPLFLGGDEHVTPHRGCILR